MASIRERNTKSLGVVHDVRWKVGDVEHCFTVYGGLKHAEACKAYVEWHERRGHPLVSRPRAGEVTPELQAGAYLNVTEESLGEVVGRPSSRGITFGELWRLWMNSRVRDEQTNYRMTKVFTKHFADWGMASAGSLTNVEILARFRALQSVANPNRVAKSTATLYMGYALSVLRHGHLVGRLSGPFIDTKAFKKEFNPSKRAKRDHKVLTDDAFAVVLSLIKDEQTKVLAETLDATGCRIGEALAFCVDDVDLANWRVFVGHHMVGDERRPGTKRNSEATRWVPLNDASAVGLAKLIEGRAGHEPVFLNPSGKFWNYNTWLRLRWLKVQDVVDAHPFPLVVDMAGRKVRLLPHNFRHGMVTREARAGDLSPHELMDTTGHSNLSTLQGYYEDDSQKSTAKLVAARRRRAA